MKEYIEYFKNSEKKAQCRRMGAEVEHLILDKDYKWVPYERVEKILKGMEALGWKAHLTDGRLLGVDLEGKHITLEPGSQFEISLDPKASISELEESYKEAMRDALQAIHEEGLKLYALAYQPFTEKEDIIIIPKRRYDYMNEYFKDKGKLAHNMMRASASSQFAIDYQSEEEFVKLYQTMSRLGPYLSLIFDNTPFISGKPYKEHLFRTKIWQNCDDQRCGLIDGGLNKDFGYKDYVNHILNYEPILEMKEGVAHPTYRKKTKELLGDTYDKETWEHFLSMGFFDVRAKSYLEIRMIDSVPYPYNFAAVALIKGIVYSNALDELSKELGDVTEEKLLKVTKEIMEDGYRAEGVHDFIKKLLKLSEEGLSYDEKHYLEPLKPLIEKGQSLKDYLQETYESEGLDSMMEKVEVTLEKLS